MNRFKFRVWDKNKKEFWSYENKAYLNVSLTFDGLPLFWTGDECRFEGKIWPEEWVIQQFTGLKDKNNKEVYEGDIVKIDFDSTGKDPCIFNYSVKFGKHYDDLEYTKIGFYVDKTDNYANINFCNGEIEVIGNIFENPELLK